MFRTYLFLFSFLAATFSGQAHGGELAVESVVSMPEVHGFLGADRLGQAHPDAPAELAQFGRLVGIWEAQTEIKAQDGAWVRTEPAVWIWKYTLGGFATQDLWIQPKDHLPSYLKSLGRTYLLTSLRLFEPSSNRWRIAWATNGAGQGAGQDFGTFTAVAQGDDMVLTGSSSYGKQRVTFSEVTESSFVWTSEYSPKDGEWMAVMRVRAQRRE